MNDEVQVFRVVGPDGETSRRGSGYGGTLRYAEDLQAARRQCAQAPKGSRVQRLSVYPSNVGDGGELYWEDVL